MGLAFSVFLRSDNRSASAPGLPHVCPTESNLTCDGALPDHIDMRAKAKLFILLRPDAPRQVRVGALALRFH